LFAEIRLEKFVGKFCRRNSAEKKSAEILFAEIRLKKNQRKFCRGNSAEEFGGKFLRRNSAGKIRRKFG
jgi:hypothetical protein